MKEFATRPTFDEEPVDAIVRKDWEAEANAFLGLSRQEDETEEELKKKPNGSG